MNGFLRTIMACLAALTLAAAAPEPPMTAGEQARAEAAIERGRLLFELDRAAWVTTDDMFSRLHSRGNVPIRGWVTERGADNSYVVTYFGDAGTGPFAWYSGVVREGKLVSGELFAQGLRPLLTPAQLRLKAAADTARSFRDYRPCTAAPFNLAIVPPETATGPIEAYLLSSQTEAGVYPLGGHFLLRIDSGKIVSHRRFMKSCMNLNTGAVAGKGAPVALVVAHLLDPSPTEIHVFASLSMRKAIYVTTGKTLWAVEGWNIRVVERK
jgi:hypothetical protein